MNETTDRGARELWSAHLARHGLKRSAQREAILATFLRAESHLSVDDLLRLVRRRWPRVGRTTVWRTLKLLRGAGLATELRVEGQARFEREFGRQHHDHFICSGCGGIFEFVSPEIERLQAEAAAALGFQIEGHRHEIFGRCRRCAARPRSPRGPARA